MSGEIARLLPALIQRFLDSPRGIGLIQHATPDDPDAKTRSAAK